MLVNELNLEEVVSHTSVKLNVPNNYNDSEFANMIRYRLGTKEVKLYEPYASLTMGFQSCYDLELAMNKQYFDALLKSIEVEFNPLETTSMTTTRNNEENRSVNDTTNKTYSDSNTTENASTNSISGTSTDDTSTSKNTYDSGSLNVTDKVANSNESTSDTTSSSNGSGTGTGTSNDTREVTENVTHDDVEEVKGFSSVNYRDAISSVYETKLILWYTTVIDTVFKNLTYSEWEF